MEIGNLKLGIFGAENPPQSGGIRNWKLDAGYWLLVTRHLLPLSDFQIIFVLAAIPHPLA